MVLEEQLDQLAIGCRVLEMEGHGDMTLGHLSLRDPEGRGFWLKRNARGLGEILTHKDFVLVSLDGEKLAGEGGLHSEWPIHSEILRLRPDVQVVAHTHPFYASVLSAFDTELLPFTLDADYFDALPCHSDDVALLKTKDDGIALARTLGAHFAVLMANHGVTFCGTSIAHAVCVGVFLEKAARTHVQGMQIRADAGFPDAEIRERRRHQIMTSVHVEHSWHYFVRKLQRIEQVNGLAGLYS